MSDRDFMAQLREAALAGGVEMEEIERRMSETALREQTIENAERRRVAQMIADTFGTPAGQQCLTWLRERTIDRPPTADEMAETDPQAFALKQARRQGATNLVFQVLSAIETARGMNKEGFTDAS